MTENEQIKNIRKDYHLYTYINNYTLKEDKRNSRNGLGNMEIQLTESEYATIRRALKHFQNTIGSGEEPVLDNLVSRFYN